MAASVAWEALGEDCEAPWTRPFPSAVTWVTRGFTFAARHGELHALDDDPVGLGEARADDAQAADQRTGFDRLGRDRAVLADDQHDLARLVGADGCVRHQQRRRGSAVGQPHVAEHARRQEVIGVGERPPAPGSCPSSG